MNRQELAEEPTPHPNHGEFGLDEINCNVEIKFRLPERKQPMTQLSQPLQRANAKLMSIVPLRLQVSDILGSRDSKRRSFWVLFTYVLLDRLQSRHTDGWKQDVEEEG